MSSSTPARISVRKSRAATILVAVAAVLSALVLLAPIVAIVVHAFGAGVAVYLRNVMHPDTLHAVGLTVFASLVAVPLNVVFGVCAAWAICRFRFPGRKLLIAFIEIPFSVSPVVAGVAYLFVYGDQGLLGPALRALDTQIMFTVAAVVLASMFVTSPYVARELIAVMQVQGTEDEEAATSLGASGWQTFFMVTLPNIKWGLLYGAILCNARVMGEFGAVSVVSGNIRGQTNTLPLHIELLYHDYNTAGAFAAATLLTLLALLTLLVKRAVEKRSAAARLVEA